MAGDGTSKIKRTGICIFSYTRKATSVNISIVEGDLLDQDVDVIVNAWNRSIMP